MGRSFHIWFVVAFFAYLATGLFIVPANEKAIVRRFGKPVLPPRSSGMNFDMPWPMSRVDRVNFHEVRTLSLGDADVDTSFLHPTSSARPISFLTGDKNLLLIRISVQYRISEEHVIDWLYSSKSPLQQLQSLVETITNDLVLRSGVDFVHTQGLAELNNRLLRDVRHQSDLLQLGCEIEQVTVDRAEPPARVKAEFLDVSNARADMSRSIHEAKSYSEQLIAESGADAKKLIDNAERDHRSRISSARGSADRFVTLVTQIRRNAEEEGQSYFASRQIVMNRLMLETVRDVLQKSKLKVVLEGDRPFDLTFPKRDDGR